VVMDFFGRRSIIPKGPAFFSLKMRAPIIPMFITRTSQDHFEVNIYPPIDPPYLPERKITDDIAIPYIQKYLKIIEGEIRKNPSQWLIFRELEQS